MPVVHARGVVKGFGSGRAARLPLGWLVLGPAQILLTAGGLGILGAIVALAVGTSVSREPVVAGLREDA